MIIQNTITNFVSLLDNIMVGQVGTLQMSGVSIANQLIMVFSVCVFGASSSAGIFTAQFHGSQDTQGIRYTHRYKVWVCVILSILGIGIFLLGGSPLIRTYLLGEGSANDAAVALEHGTAYLKIMLIGFIPFAFSNAYASTLRETEQAVVPMVSGIIAVFVNLILNYVLIFGHFGAPKLGVEGAAIATVISRFVEMAIVVGWTHLHPSKNPFVKGLYRSMHIPKALFFTISKKGMPLLLNEVLWSSGLAITNQCLSTCCLDVIPAINISGTIYNLANVTCLAMGNVVGIVMGQMIGSGVAAETVRKANRQLLAMVVASGAVFGALLIAFSGRFPLLYNTTDSVRQLATTTICISAAIMPFTGYAIGIYYTLRSGGKTFITMLVDGGYVFCVCLPVTWLLCQFTPLGIVPIYALSRGTDILRCVVGEVLLRKSTWIQNLTK